MDQDINHSSQARERVGTTFAVAESINDVTGLYNERSITYNGSLKDLDIDAILRQKQEHIIDIFKLGDYYVDAEELIGSAIKKIYVPFTLSEGWYLTAGTAKTRAKYEEWFKLIHLNEKLKSWFYQYYLFANVYFSLMDDGDLITLPPHLCRISNVLINGNPLVEFNARSIKQDFRKSGMKAYKKFIDDDELNVRIAGLPKEVSEALTKNVEYVQLDPKTTFIFQGEKPEWARYAMPMIVQALKPLARKEIIVNYENALLTLAACGFLHTTVGAPPDSNMVADNNILTAVQNQVKTAVKAGGGLLTTNDFVTTEFVQVDVDHMWDKAKYEDVDTSILGAFGISNAVSAGGDASTSFGSSQISTRLVSMRINAAKKAFCEFMNMIIRAVNGSPYGLPRTTNEKLPVFCMPQTDLTKIAAFQEECMKLWESGNLSRRTMLEAHGIDVEMEYERKKQEMDNGYDDVFVKPGTNPQNNSEPDAVDGDVQIGRPTMDDSERNSAPDNSDTGRQPKPSRPEGSEAQDE